MVSNFIGASRSLLTVMFFGQLLAPTYALPLIVQNGSFETTTDGSGDPGGAPTVTNSGTGRVGYNVDLTNWFVNPYTDSGQNSEYVNLFTPATANTGTIPNTFSPNVFSLWNGSNSGANNITVSPDGGNFLAFDGAAYQGPLSQNLSGLTVGQEYAVSFYYAGAEQFGYTGATTEAFSVNLADSLSVSYSPVGDNNNPAFTSGTTYTTLPLNNIAHGFTGWQQQTFDFTADNQNEVLSFLAVGTPNGLPPFALLDGVSMTPVVPEIDERSALLPVALVSGLMMILADRRKRRLVDRSVN